MTNSKRKARRGGRYKCNPNISRSAAHEHHLVHVENSMALRQYKDGRQRRAKA